MTQLVPRYTEQGFRKYTSAIGEAVMAWNDLNENFAFVFVVLLSHGLTADERNVTIDKGYGIFNCVTSDRNKRSMLQALSRNMSKEEQKELPKLMDSIDFLCSESNKIEALRNDIIHAPLDASFSLKDIGIWLQNGKLTKGPSSVYVRTSSQHPRAISIAKQPGAAKGLLGQIQWFRDSSIVLRDYALDLGNAVLFPQRAWPGIPLLPNRTASNKPKTQPRRRRAKK